MVLVGFIISGFLNVKACSAFEYVWTQKTDMPTPRWNLATCVVNGKIYAMGGEPSENRQIEWVPHSTVEEYDPVSDTWAQKADMPVQRVCFDISVVDGKIYAIGGDSSGSRVDMYDPSTDTWTQKADMPTPRWFLATCVVDGKIYAIGGYLSWDFISGLKIIEEYDPATDSWTRKKDMPIRLWGQRANAVGGKIYTVGGRKGLLAVPCVQEYDPATDTWTQKGDMPIGTSQMASAVLGDKIMVIGGWFWSMDFPYTAVQMYDPETDIWTIEGDTPFLKAAFSGEFANNKIYVIGGTDRPHPCPATSTVYELTINLLPPDFNGDGIVDAIDMCIMVDNWGTDNSLYDIGPMPWGDSIVDVEDLKVLAGYLFEDVNDPTLIAHWPLDEAQGVIAYDNASDCDGTLMGGPIWQFDGGMVGGALQFDGMDDYVRTDHFMNPAEGKFSVIAWINGGAPGQVILSQADGSNWLSTDSVEGCLMTELKSSGRPSSGPLLSGVCITDDTWHRIGLVWDGSHRHLYVDGIEVAKDPALLSDLEDDHGGLYFGTGSTLAPGSFFSGLIDDIRIYNRIVNP